MRVAHTATLFSHEQTVISVSALLHAERARRGGTRTGIRAPSRSKQAILVIRWLLTAERRFGCLGGRTSRVSCR